jgi:lysophospholipase L1-like esterase
VPKVLVLLAVLGFACPALADSQESPALKKGDRVVFLGDSITQGGNSHAKGYVKLIEAKLKRDHADLGVEVIGAGISGNKVPDLQRRLDKDVLAKKPTVVVVYIGINDVWHGEKDPKRGTTEGGLRGRPQGRDRPRPEAGARGDRLHAVGHRREEGRG